MSFPVVCTLSSIRRALQEARHVSLEHDTKTWGIFLTEDSDDKLEDAVRYIYDMVNFMDHTAVLDLKVVDVYLASPRTRQRIEWFRRIGCQQLYCEHGHGQREQVSALTAARVLSGTLEEPCDCVKNGRVSTQWE